jgi:hypothetical protein
LHIETNFEYEFSRDIPNQVNKNAALPTGEPLKNVNREAYPFGNSRGLGPNSRGKYPQKEHPSRFIYKTTRNRKLLYRLLI